MTELAKIWVPGESLDHHYPVATGEQLAEQLKTMVDGEVIILDDVLGVMRTPEDSEAIKGVISADLCEVVRQTGQAVVSTASEREYKGGLYYGGLWKDERMGVDAEYSVVVERAILKSLMNKGHIPPVDDYQEIGAMMRRWRKDHNMYVVANTSTLEGCEIATMESLQEYYPDCFDGIVFPRNHDGMGRITKAAALGIVLDELEKYGQSPTSALHIDDTPHHIEAMITTPPHDNMRLFVPAYETNAELAELANVVRDETPLHVFMHMDKYIREQ